MGLVIPTATAFGGVGDQEAYPITGTETWLAAYQTGTWQANLPRTLFVE
jgi:hypothetical protein